MSKLRPWLAQNSTCLLQSARTGPQGFHEYILGQLACVLRSAPRELQASLASLLHASSLLCSLLQDQQVIWQLICQAFGGTVLPSSLQGYLTRQSQLNFQQAALCQWHP